MSEQFANNASTTLSTAISSTSATSITVTSVGTPGTPGGFPSTGNFRILVDNEFMLVTSLSGTTWTVTRGIEGSTAATHSSGAQVTQIVTAGALAAIAASGGTGAIGGGPAGAPQTGTLGIPTTGSGCVFADLTAANVTVPLGSVTSFADGQAIQIDSEGPYALVITGAYVVNPSSGLYQNASVTPVDVNPYGTSVILKYNAAKSAIVGSPAWSWA